MRFFVVFTFLFFVGCSASHQLSHYKSASVEYEDIDEPARAEVLATGSPLTLGVWLEGALTQEDRMLKVNRMPAYYDVLTFQIDEPGDYELKVKAICDCLGFQKVLIRPDVQLFDTTHQLVPLSEARSGGGSPEGLTIMANVNTYWRVSLSEPGSYYLVLSSDNDRLGETLIIHSEGYGNHTGGGVISLPLVSHPYGEYFVKITEI